MYFSDNETYEANFTFDALQELAVGRGDVHIVIPSDVTFTDETGGQEYVIEVALVEFDVHVPGTHSSGLSLYIKNISYLPVNLFVI